MKKKEEDKLASHQTRVITVVHEFARNILFEHVKKMLQLSSTTLIKFRFRPSRGDSASPYEISFCKEPFLYKFYIIKI